MDAQLRRFYLASVLSIAIPSVVAAQGGQAGFRETEIVIQSDGIDLAGTLTLPTGPGTHPAVVLIPAATGSGRDVCSGAFCSFREIAQGLASRGIAVVRYDERGSGSSGGEQVWQYTVQDYARDADAAVDYLAKQPDVDPERVGVIGHSLGGGVVAPMAYLGSSSISYVVSLLGEGLSFADVRLGYLRGLGEANGKSEPEISEAIRFEREVVHEAVRRGGDWPSISDELRQQAFIGWWDEMTIAVGPTPFFKSVLDLEPVDLWRQVHCPVLLVFGGADDLVIPAVNRGVLVQALDEAGNEAYAVHVVEGMGHDLRNLALSQTALASGLVDAIAEWLLATTKTVQ